MAGTLAQGHAFAHDATLDATLDLSKVTVRVHWSTPAEISKARRKYAPAVRTRPGLPPRGDTKGFSVLRLDTATGEYVCDLYVNRPERADDDHTTTVGHELLHCLLGAYHD